MNTNTTTSTTLAIDSKAVAAAHGFRGILPVTFPTVEQLAKMRELVDITNSTYLFDLVELADKILAAGPAGLTAADRRALWAYSEENFLRCEEETWPEYLASTTKALEEAAEQEKQAPGVAFRTEFSKAPEQAKAVTLQTLTDKDVKGLQAIYNENQNARVPAATWKRAFSGACASRRAGMDFRIWAKRCALPRSIVADIAFRVWSLPESELIGNAPVRRPF